MVISLFVCIYSFPPLSSILSPSILHLQAPLLPAPTGVSRHCWCCSSPGWSRLCYEAVGPISFPVTVSASLKVQKEKEIAWVALEVRDRWQPSQVYDPVQKLSAFSHICPGSNFLSGPWASPCWLCVSVHLFPCLSICVYVFSSCLSLSHSAFPPHALPLHLSLSLSTPHLSHPHLFPSVHFCTYLPPFLSITLSPKVSHRNGNPSHSPPPHTGLLLGWLVLPPPQIKGREGGRR